MKRAISLTCVVSLLGLAGLTIMSCSSGEDSWESEGVGAVGEDLSKCLGGKLGDSNYCTATCKCSLGEGDCDSAAECGIDPMLGQLACSGKGIYYGHPAGNACAPAYCNNKKKDGDETQIDCGGSCGTVCPNQCSTLPVDGKIGHCTTACPCTAGHGDCNAANNVCAAGNFCKANVGTSYGFASNVDICLANHCTNAIKDSDELAVDCGGSCLPCSGATNLSFAKGGAGPDHGMDLAIDSAEGIIIAGRFGGTTQLGGPALTAAGGADVFVARYSNTGEIAFAKRFGGGAADGDLGVSVAVDNARNIYLAGNYRGTIDFGGGHTHTSVGTTDAFVVKLNQTGTALWSRSYGGASATRVNNLAVSPAGDVFVAGSFASPTTSFGGVTKTNAGSSGIYDAFVLRLSTAAGATVYATSFGSTGPDHALDIAVDASLKAYVTGSFVGTAAGMTASGTTQSDGYAMQLSAAGAITWAHPIGGIASDATVSIGLDTTGPVVGGRFRNSVDFGNGTPVTATGNTSGFVLAYTTAGVYRWHKTYLPTTGVAETTAVAGGTTGVVVGGFFQGSVNFGAGAIASSGTQSLFIVKYNAAGTLLSSKTYNPTGTANLLGAVQAGSMLGVTGDFQGSINMGGGALTGGGDDDIFFARAAF